MMGTSQSLSIEAGISQWFIGVGTHSVKSPGVSPAGPHNHEQYPINHRHFIFSLSQLVKITGFTKHGETPF
jgi:uncharacterized protein (UPF0128 family)